MAPLYFKAATKYGFLLFSSLISLTLPDAANAASAAPGKKIVTVTAQRVPVPVDETGSSVTIFTQEDIEQRQYRLQSDDTSARAPEGDRRQQHVAREFRLFTGGALRPRSSSVMLPRT